MYNDEYYDYDYGYEDSYDDANEEALDMALDMSDRYGISLEEAYDFTCYALEGSLKDPHKRELRETNRRDIANGYFENSIADLRRSRERDLKNSYKKYNRGQMTEAKARALYERRDRDYYDPRVKDIQDEANRNMSRYGRVTKKPYVQYNVTKYN